MNENNEPSGDRAVAPAAAEPAPEQAINAEPQSDAKYTFEIGKGQQVLNVQNVALATAEAIQKPSPWTKSMLKVR